MAKLSEDDGYYMSGPEEGDKIDQSVWVCNCGGEELFEITEGTLRKRKSFGRRLAKLMNEAGARFE